MPGCPAGPSEVQMLGGQGGGDRQAFGTARLRFSLLHLLLCVLTVLAPTSSPACAPSMSVTVSVGFPRPVATPTLHPAPSAPLPAALNKAFQQALICLLWCCASAPMFPCVPPTASRALSRLHPRGPVPVPHHDPCHGLGSSVTAPVCPTVLPLDLCLARRSRTPLSLAWWLVARLPPG